MHRITSRTAWRDYLCATLTEAGDSKKQQMLLLDLAKRKRGVRVYASSRVATLISDAMPEFVAMARGPVVFACEGDVTFSSESSADNRRALEKFLRDCPEYKIDALNDNEINDCAQDIAEGDPQCVSYFETGRRHKPRIIVIPDRWRADDFISDATGLYVQDVEYIGISDQDCLRLAMAHEMSHARQPLIDDNLQQLHKKFPAQALRAAQGLDYINTEEEFHESNKVVLWRENHADLGMMHFVDRHPYLFDHDISKEWVMQIRMLACVLLVDTEHATMQAISQQRPWRDMSVQGWVEAERDYNHIANFLDVIYEAAFPEEGDVEQMLQDRDNQKRVISTAYRLSQERVFPSESPEGKLLNLFIQAVERFAPSLAKQCHKMALPKMALPKMVFPGAQHKTHKQCRRQTRQP